MDCSGNEGWIQVALPYSEVTRTLARRDPGRNMFRNWRGLDEIESEGIGSDDEEIGKSRNRDMDTKFFVTLFWNL